jgi:hypothetical protein
MKICIESVLADGYLMMALELSQIWVLSEKFTAGGFPGVKSL